MNQDHNHYSQGLCTTHPNFVDHFEYSISGTHQSKSAFAARHKMAENCSYSFQDAMDKLWFHQNILLWEPSGISFQSLVRSTRAATSSPTVLLSNKSSTIENGRSTSVNKKREIVHKEKMPMKLNIAVDQPLFQLQLPRISIIQEPPRPSTPCFDAGSPSKHMPIFANKEAKSFKSSSELENYEIKGFLDLGFVFHKERLSPQLISILPGLERLQEKCGDSEKLKEVDEEHAKRPYLSEAWSIRRADSPQLDPQLLFKSQPAEMQNHLRFWARNVASTIRHDLDVI